MGEKVINAALLGLGTVGTGVYKVLKNQEEEMTAKIGCKVKIRKILVRNLEKAAGKVDDPAVLTNSWEDIKADPSIDIIIELIGGIEPARTYILDALHAGKHVVTANKDLIAVHGKELMDTARASHVDFLFEAAVAGGIPIIRPLKQCLAGNHMSEVMGIVNGTTNFILTKMSQENMEFKDALALATELGYAEADPTAQDARWLFSPALLLIPEWYLMMFISKESQKFPPRTSAMQKRWAVPSSFLVLPAILSPV